MTAYSKSILLFALNLLDAQLTVIWVSGGWATEGNALMARLMEAGYEPFLFTKLCVGALVAHMLYRWSYLTLVRRGLNFVLSLYLLLMLVHAATGISALGWRTPDSVAALVLNLPTGLLALLS